MRISLRALIVGSNIVLLIVGFFCGYFPLRSTVSRYFYNKFIKEENKEQSLVAAVAANPLNYAAHTNLGYLYFDQGKYSDAIRELKLYTEMLPFDAADLIKMGDTYEKINEHSLAVIEYENSLKMEPNNIDALWKLSTAYENMGNQEDSFMVVYNIALLASESDQKLLALEKLRDIITQNPDRFRLEPGIPLGFSRQSSVAIDNTGKMYFLATSVEYPQLLMIASSLDNGKTWEEKRILYIGRRLDGILTIDHTGIVHAAFGESKGVLIYTNSKSDFKSLLTLAQDADYRQMAIDNLGIVHLVWADKNSKIFHKELLDQVDSESEMVAIGWNPSIAISQERLFMTYNLPVSFPGSSGGVCFTERISGKWMEGIKISSDNVWAGASVLTTIQNSPHVVFIEDATPDPRLIYAYRDESGNWERLFVDEEYQPYVPTSTSFGGRTSPGIKNIDTNLLFLWRATGGNSSIIIRKFDTTTGLFGKEQIIGYLGDAPINYAPSFASKQVTDNHFVTSWARDGLPVINIFAQFDLPR